MKLPKIPTPKPARDVQSAGTLKTGGHPHKNLGKYLHPRKGK